MIKTRFFTIIVPLFLLPSISIVTAQSACASLVQQALNSIGDYCGDLDRNSVCYGHNNVIAQFFDAYVTDKFDQPADTVPLDHVGVVRTAGLDESNEVWGVAVMNLQANIPNSIPGQSVKVLLIGDVEVESAVQPDEAYEPIDPIPIAVTYPANIRSGHGTNYNVVGSVPATATLLIDGQSPDGDWLRTTINDQIGWVYYELLAKKPDVPVINESLKTPMQSIFLRTGFGQPACEEAPEDSLLIQGPKGFEIDFTVNGTSIKISSTIRIRSVDEGDAMEIEVLDGRVVIPEGGENGQDVVINAGSSSRVCLGDEGSRGIDGQANDKVPACDWTPPQYKVPTLRKPSDCQLEGIPQDGLNYPITFCSAPPVPVAVSADGEVEVSGDGGNRCDPGNVWDDGRCEGNQWWWQAGYFYGQVDEGLISVEDIPPAFLTPADNATYGGGSVDGSFSSSSGGGTAGGGSGASNCGTIFADLCACFGGSYCLKPIGPTATPRPTRPIGGRGG